MELDQGFLGHAAIGAATMSLVALHEDRQPWKQVVEKLRGDISQPAGARVFLVASVFGGTGASAIHPIVRFLRKIPETNPERLRIGVAALVPYSRFEASTTTGESELRELAAKSERFPLATRSAVEFYQHLRENTEWPFDSMYWVGDNSPIEVSYAPGGPGQKNPAHFVDLLAAISCLEFFERPGTAKSCFYSGPRQDVEPELGDVNLLEWSDLPLEHLDRKEIQSKLLRLFVVGVVHLGFCNALFQPEFVDHLEQRAFCVPWYLDRFALKGDRFTSPENQRAAGLLTQFFNTYHFPWWAQIHRKETVRLFNRAAMRGNEDRPTDAELDRLANLLWPDRPG